MAFAFFICARDLLDGGQLWRRAVLHRGLTRLDFTQRVLNVSVLEREAACAYG